MQGLEKLNDVTKNNFFRQTNRRKNEYTTTLLEKANRTEFINLKGEVSEIYAKIDALQKAEREARAKKEKEEEEEEEKEKEKSAQSNI